MLAMIPIIPRPHCGRGCGSRGGEGSRGYRSRGGYGSRGCGSRGIAFPTLARTTCILVRRVGKTLKRTMIRWTPAILYGLVITLPFALVRAIASTM